MPQSNKDAFVCFVHGHGAKFSSSSSQEKTPNLGRNAPSSRALQFARERAAAQLAFQRAAEIHPVKK